MTRRPLAATSLALLLALSGCGGDAPRPEATTGDAEAPVATTRVEVVEPRPAGAEFDPRAIYERGAPGVVTVISLFGSPGAREKAPQGGRGGVGSGFVLSGRGEIVTNAHVVSSGEGEAARLAREVYVEFSDRNKVPARVVGYDLNADVALLRVRPGGLTLRPLPLGSSAEVEVGQPVAAIGSPFGERQSLSIGVVSAIDRSIRSLTAFDIPGAIQTDAAINPGNSGGPLVDARGQVVGINQQIRSSSGSSEGVGFAVPIDMVKRSIRRLRDDGAAEYAYLGVSTVPLYPQLVERFDLPTARGVWLQAVSADGPADRAGLREGSGKPVSFQGEDYLAGGDVITGLDGRRILDADDLAVAVTRHEPGERVTIELWRDGDRHRLPVTLGERPATSDELP